MLFKKKPTMSEGVRQLIRKAEEAAQNAIGKAEAAATWKDNADQVLRGAQKEVERAKELMAAAERLAAAESAE